MTKLAMLFLSVFFGRCTSQPKTDFVKLQAEELEVIKQTFPAIDFPTWRLVKIPETSSEKINSGSRSHPLKTQIWFVKDTLFNPANFPSGNEYHRDLRIKLDTTFFDLQKKLFTSSYPKQALKLAGLIFKDDTFVSEDSTKKYKKIAKRLITLTRVVFNPNHTKACYYITYSFPENHQASGEILFAEKKNDKWYLIYKNLYWIT